VARIIRFLNYFLTGKRRGLGPQLVDHNGAGPRWTLDKGSMMTSSELNLAAALGHDGSPAMAQQREEKKNGERCSVLGAGGAWAWREEKKNGERYDGGQ
jgi:hypothetical protein